jgi:hypothetical protein
VARDNTVSFSRLKLQLPQSPLHHHYVKARVIVREYPDRTLAIFHGPRCIGRYDADAAGELDCCRDRDRVRSGAYRGEPPCVWG